MSNSISSSDIPSISTLASLLPVFADIQAAVSEPINLFAMSNSISFAGANTNANIENSGTSTATVNWTNNWYAGFSWDLKFDFDWNLEENLTPLTYETIKIELNPTIDTYAYLTGYFQWFFTDMWFVEISAYVQPVHAHLLQAKFWQPVTMPDWWNTPFTQSGRCRGLNFATFPLEAQINLTFGWPTCDWSTYDFLTWVDPLYYSNSVGGVWNSLQRRFEANTANCTGQVYGYGYGNDVPLLSWSAFDYMDHKYEIIPFQCYEIVAILAVEEASATPVVAPAK